MELLRSDRGGEMTLSACGHYTFTTTFADMMAAWAKYCADDLDGHALDDLRDWWPTATKADRREFLLAARNELLALGYTGPVVEVA